MTANNPTMQKVELYKQYRVGEISITRLVDEVWLIDNPPVTWLEKIILRLHRVLSGGWHRGNGCGCNLRGLQ